MKWIIGIIFLVIVLLGLCSCGQKQWKQRGFKKGWIDTSEVTNTVTLPPDTVKIDSIVNNFITDLDTLLNDTCLSKEKKERIKWIIKEKFIPQIIKGTFPDTTIIQDGVKINFKNTDKGIKLSFDYPKMEIKERKLTWLQLHAMWFVWASIILFLLFLAFLTRK